MELDFKLPVGFRGKPKGCRDVRNVFLTKSVSAEIPEVSLRDTEVAFTVAGRQVQIGRQQEKFPMERVDAVRAAGLKPFELRSFEGDLYRKISRSAAEADRLGLFALAFERNNSGRRNKAYPVLAPWECEYGADISPAQVFADNRPLARPLMDEMEWMMDRTRASLDGGRAAWPPIPAGERGYDVPYHAHRNNRHIETEIANISEIDWETLTLSEEMIRAQIDKLLVIDGEVWIKSRQPAISVDRDFVWRRHDNINIRLVTAPEVYVSKLACGYFSLADINLAREYAEKLMAEESVVVDSTDVSYDCHDDGLLDYDWRGEAINRFGYAAAVECHSYFQRNPAKIEKLTSDEISVMGRAFDETMNVNHILGVHRDMSAYAPTLNAIWKKFSYRQGLAVGITSGFEVESLANSIGRYLDEAPVSLNLTAVDREHAGRHF